MDRLDIFYKLIFEKLGSYEVFWSTSFGSGTNTAILLSSTMGNSYGIVADSMFNSLIKNIGLMGTLIYIIMLYRVFGINKESKYLMIIYFIFSLTNIITESFPMNILFSVNIAYFLSSHRKRIFNKHPLMPLVQKTADRNGTTIPDSDISG